MLGFDQLLNEQLIVCPRCSCPVEGRRDALRCGNAACSYSVTGFPTVDGHPALVDFEVSIVARDQLVRTAGHAQIDRSGGGRLRRALGRRLHPRNRQTPVHTARMVALLTDDTASDRKPRVLIVGGGEVGSGLEALYSSVEVDLLAFDIYASPLTQFIADAHRIPLASGSMDGVIVQAVLEHVLEPNVVASEIHRVLRAAGIVYADTPFLQQVHEGPYDFTRFTDSGHRYLFRRFERLGSGLVAGAGTQLVWSIDHFVRALFRSVPAGRAARLLFVWLSWTDRFLDTGHSLDSASSVFFLGRKSDTAMSQHDIVAYYQGGM